MSLRDCRLLVCERIDQLNARQQPRTHTRLVKYQDSQEKAPKEFTTHPKAITVASRHVLLYVLQRARKQVAKIQKLEQQMPGLWAQHVTDTGDQVPPITFNCVELSRRLGTCEKSIRTYVLQWLAAGIVTKKKFHGRKANLELWVNPEYLWKTPLKTVQNPVLEHTAEDQQEPILSTNEKNLPPKSFQNLLETQRLLFTNVDKLHSDEVLKPSSGSGGLHQAPSATPVGLKARRQAVKTTTETIAAGGAARPAGGLDDAKKEGYVTALALYSVALLWPEKSYCLEKAKQSIRTGVFNDWERAEEYPLEQWEKFHEQCMRRIELVRDYVVRYPHYEVAAPYSLIITGKGWFDKENPKGFHGTRTWYLADQRRKNARKLQDALRQAVREITTRHKLERHNNPTRMKASKRVRHTDMLSLHQHHITILSRLGGQEAVNRFNAKVAALLS